MKNVRFIVTLFFALLLSLLTYSCQQEEPGYDQLPKKVQELESKVDSLQKEEIVKSGVVSSQLTNEEEKRGCILEVIDVFDKGAYGSEIRGYIRYT